MIVEAFYSHLKASATVRAACKWIYPHVIPANREAPAITYRLDEDQRERLFAGEGDYRQAMFTVDCYSLSYQDAHGIGNAVESALIDYRGALGSTSPTVDADHIRLLRRLDIFEADTKLHRVSLQFLVGYE